MLFARGAIRAALWGQTRPPGQYGMIDVLGLHDPDAEIPTAERASLPRPRRFEASRMHNAYAK